MNDATLEKLDYMDKKDNAGKHCRQAETAIDCDLCPVKYNSNICNEVRQIIKEASPSSSPAPYENDE